MWQADACMHSSFFLLVRWLVGWLVSVSTNMCASRDKPWYIYIHIRVVRWCRGLHVSCELIWVNKQAAINSRARVACERACGWDIFVYVFLHMDVTSAVVYIVIFASGRPCPEDNVWNSAPLFADGGRALLLQHVPMTDAMELLNN